MHRRAALLAIAVSAFLLIGLSTEPVLAAGDDDIPGVPTGAGVTSGVVDETTDPYDVYCMKLFEDELVHFHLATSSSGGGLFDYAWAELIPPGVTSIHSSYSELARVTTHPFSFSPDADYTPAKDGVYYLVVGASGNGISYTIAITGSAEKPPNPTYLRLRTSAKKVKKGRSITLSARLVDGGSAPIAGYAVTLYRSFPGKAWRKSASLTSQTGTYAIRLRITRKTKFRMSFSGDSTWSSCKSRVVTVGVR